MEFLPVSKLDMENRGWQQLDFLFITGDAYVDHPSFAHALLSRVLEHENYKVGIVSMPTKPADLTVMGTPRLGVLVSSGNIDSMVCNYTTAKRKRSEDSYAPGGKGGLRPDRALSVYCKMAREAFPDLPIIAGGVEGSLRRFAHYDYWSDRVMRPILFDCGADLLVYGMGERILVQVAKALADGYHVSQLTWLDGTAYVTNHLAGNEEQIPSYERVCESKMQYAKAHKLQNTVITKTLAQPCQGRFLIQNPPAESLDRAEMDAVYDLSFIRNPHPMYDAAGGVPAIEEGKFSVTSSRGCFGSCNFCALTFHQGRVVHSRSHDSIVKEVEHFTKDKDFKGYVHDVGGPTANFRQPACDKQLTHGVCPNKKCLTPAPCKNLKVSHTDYVALLDKLRKVDGVKKVFIRSGIRFDYVMADKDDAFLQTLCRHHISGQLKVAPEHVSDEVLRLMGKPRADVYKAFSKKYYAINKKIGKEQYLVPYLMSSHPGSTLKSAIELACYLRKEGIRPQQVQDFYPTPGTASTCMYYTGIHPDTLERVFVARSPKEKAVQRALLQYTKPEHYDTVYNALVSAGRRDLIGNAQGCLIPNKKGEKRHEDFRRKSTIGKNKRRSSR